MNMTLSRPFRRALALLILVLLLWFGWSTVLVPVLALSGERQANISSLADQLAHLRALAARGPLLLQRVANADKALATIGSFWAGPSSTAVSASIQSALRPAIDVNGGQLRSTSEVGETNDHGFQRISIRLNIDGTMEAMQRTLMAVETCKPSLFVESFTITASDMSVRRDHPPVLTLDLTIVGYMRPDPGIAGSVKGSQS